MKEHFVLDESIMILAYKGRNEHEEADDTCWALLEEIERYCHAPALAVSFWGRYCSKVNALSPTEMANAGVLKLVASMLVNSDKDTKIVQDQNLPVIEALEDMRGVDPGDRDFVRAAACVPGSILVTTDGPLREALASNGIDRQYGFSELSPAAALPRAKPNGP